MSMALTAQQIAEKVGLSTATVSRVLNNHQNVSPDAREAVLSVVREFGQMPRLLGRRGKDSEMNKQTGVFQVLNVLRYPIQPFPEDPTVSQANAMVVPYSEYFSRENRFSSSFTRMMINGVMHEAQAIGFHTEVQIMQDLDVPMVLKQINKTSSRGVFLMGCYRQDVSDFLNLCQCPVVSFMTWDHKGWPDYVGIDNQRGIRLGFEHLKKLGHTRIGYMAGDLENNWVFRDRLAFYKALVVDAGFELRQDWITSGSCELDAMQASAEKILASEDRPTAMLCCYDGAAVAIQRAAYHLHLRIPDDLSVVGFDDSEIASLVSPPLTTIRIPWHLLGQQAVQLMMMRMQRPIQRGQGCSMRVTPELVVRASTAPPAKP
jgi:LacI family transcriptional regulator